jgi:hypothetical protein
LNTTKKDRKSKLISKRRLVRMVELFEEKIDAEIKSIDVELNSITTTRNVDYRIDFSKNSVEKIYPDPE